MKAIAIAVMLAACGRSQGHSALVVHADAAAPATANRRYDVFVPAQHAAHPALVIALHGNGGTGPQMRKYTKLDAVAEREGFIVAYPDAIDHHWNDGRPELDGTADDVAFIAALIDELAAKYPIDRARVYVTGISNGAIMSYRLACELPDRIAAIAPVAGDVPRADLAKCSPHAKTSVLAINGTDDPLVPFDGGVAGRGGQVLSAPDSVALFARAGGCGVGRTSVDMADTDPDDHTRSQRTAYTQCPAGVGIELITVENGGHTWPGAAQYLPRAVIGAAARDFSASEAIWTFFAAHPHA